MLEPAAKEPKQDRGVPQRPDVIRRHALALMLVAAFAARAVCAAVVPPQSDVYYYLYQAAGTFLSGGNPYLHLYTGIPPQFLTPGASRVFAYLPFAFIYLVPFYLAGDIRLGMIVADLAVGACLFLYGGRWRLGAAFIYLFLPFTILFSTVYINVTVMAIAFVGLFVLLDSRGRGGFAALCLGIALATVQFTLLLIPCILFYYYRTRRWAEPLLAALVAAVIILPFLLSAPSTFVQETLFFQFGRAVDPLVSWGGSSGFAVNPSLDAIWIAVTGTAVPLYVKVVVEVVAIALLARATDLSRLTRNSAFLVIISALVLPNDFFWSYLELPFVLLLFWLSAPIGLYFVED